MGGAAETRTGIAELERAVRRSTGQLERFLDDLELPPGADHSRLYQAGSSSTTYYENGAVATANDTEGRAAIDVIMGWVDRCTGTPGRWPGKSADIERERPGGTRASGFRQPRTRGVPAFLAEMIAFDGAGRPTKTPATVFAANDPLVANDQPLDDMITSKRPIWSTVSSTRRHCPGDPAGR